MPRRARRLPSQLLAALEAAKVDHILHAGDLVDMSVLEELSSLAPVTAVAGNTDSWGIAASLPRRRVVTLGGVSVGLTHGDEGQGSDTPARAFSVFADEAVAAVVFGHSHIPWNEWRDGRLLFNPGSPTDPRRQPSPTFGLIRIMEEGQPGPRLVGELRRLPS